jgi:hypothetical protein
MAPNDIFSRMTPDVASQLFSFLFEKEKQLYKATIESIAKQRNLRPVFIERKPRVERFAWMQNALGRKASESVAAHLLQVWLVTVHAPLLCDFLDGLGIEHDKNGTVDTLPPAPPKEKLAEVIESLFTKHDPAVVAVYLNAFQSLDEQGGWSTLGELIESDARLTLGAAQAS